MSRSCVICHGSSHGFTVAMNEEGERVLVHANSCAAILGERRQVAARVTPSGKPRKTAGISMWTAEWEHGRYGPQHQLPCNCPRHREEGDRSKADDITWDRVIAGNPDIEYQ